MAKWTPEQVDAALRGHPDTITAHKVLVDALKEYSDVLSELVGDGPFSDEGGECSFCNVSVFEEDTDIEVSYLKHGERCTWRKGMELVCRPKG